MPDSESPLTVLGESLRGIQDAIAAIVDADKPIFEGIAVAADINERLSKVGWLPHHTTPFKLVLEADPDKLAGCLAEYYVNEWDQIRAAIFLRVDRYDIDAEAKATFGEALSAHGYALYRSSCRVLFPEIERVLWIEVHGGAWNKDNITSQKEFIDLVGSRFPLGIVLVDPWAFELYQKLSKHVYEKVKETNWEQFESIPNRHAAVHGRIIYSSLEHSMNTIIMADYVFAVISAAKSFAKNTSVVSPHTTKNPTKATTP